jgi:chitin synthase
MYTIQADYAERVMSPDERDVEAQSMTLPRKSLLSSKLEDVCQIPLARLPALDHDLPPINAVDSPGSDFHTRPSSPSGESQSGASYSLPSVTSHSNVTSRPESLGSVRGNSSQSFGDHATQQSTVLTGYTGFVLSSNPDNDVEDARAAFDRHAANHRELITPKPWLDLMPTKPTDQDDISEDGYPQSSEAQVGGSPAEELSASSAHYEEQADPGPAFEEWMDLVTTVTPKERPEDTPRNRRRGRRTIVAQKHLMQAAIISMKYVYSPNLMARVFSADKCVFSGLCIFSTWWWSRYYYVLLPFITATVALNIIMIVSIVFNVLKRLVLPEKQTVPEKPESLVMVIPCYNETQEEMLKSLNSLISQKNISQHPRAIMIICDGKVRGPGMEKTTADYLFEDILLQKDYRIRIPAAYLAWDQQFMDIEVQKGSYQGIPYFCIVKQQNQGKRDSLIVIRSFLYNFNVRFERPETVFSSPFFAHMVSFIKKAGMDRVDHLIGMDADTVFDDDCINELLLQSRFDHVVGVCGYVAVDWKDGNFNPWRLYQSAEYTIAQGLRRLHQSVATHKVSCLPGCCQLLKICEETCGPEVLIEKFGYCPTLTDGILTQIRATASEDRNHVCHMLSSRPKVQTRQALKAKAYTDVPGSWSVFLSQRRRWTLGATSNDLFLATAPGVHWFERILAVVNVSTWFLNLFIFASVASFIVAATSMLLSPLLRS